MGTLLMASKTHIAAVTPDRGAMQPDCRQQHSVSVLAPGQDWIDLPYEITDLSSMPAAGLQLNPHRLISRPPCAHSLEALPQTLENLHPGEIQISPEPSGTQCRTTVIPPRIEGFDKIRAARSPIMQQYFRVSPKHGGAQLA